MPSAAPGGPQRPLLTWLLSGTWAALLLSALLGGCTVLERHVVASRTPADPATAWHPAAGALPPAKASAKPAPIPPELLARAQELTLEDIVDLALRNNPETRETWAAALAAAANLGSQQGAYFPQIDAAANYSRSENSFSEQFTVKQKTYTPSLTLNYILFDFGKRSGDVEEARQALYQANWSHNAMIQTVILQVETTYYQYLQAKALRDADAEAVKEAEANLEAAKVRRQAGLATVADELQARSNLAQQQLALQTVEGQIQTTRGSLATAMGLSPTIDYDVGLLPSNLPTGEVSAVVDDLIRKAQIYRPDLAASRAAVLAARAHVKSVKAEGFPQVSVQGNVSRRYYDNPNKYSDNYLAGIFLSWPLFTGFAHPYDVLQAEAQAALAQRQYETLRSSVELDVWTSYYDLKTAAERLTTARKFLDYASESHAVTLESYQSGVNSILDLLAAQTTLEEARSQEVQARTDWFLALAQLAHATGRLGSAEPQPTTTPPAVPAKDGGR
jgi:outer membrane protein